MLAPVSSPLPVGCRADGGGSSGLPLVSLRFVIVAAAVAGGGHSFIYSSRSFRMASARLSSRTVREFLALRSLLVLLLLVALILLLLLPGLLSLWTL